MRTRDEFIDWQRLSRWQPLLSYEPIIGSEISIVGTYQLNVILDQSIEIQDSLPIRIIVPENFRLDPPRVILLDHKIPWNADMHVETDGKICLSAPIALGMFLATNKDLSCFLKHFLDPYLARAFIAISNGSNTLKGSQLLHGQDGIKQDLMQRLGLSNFNQVNEVISLLPMSRKEAGEQLCPCGCRKLLKKCELAYRIDCIRKMAPRNSILHFIGIT